MWEYHVGVLFFLSVDIFQRVCYDWVKFSERAPVAQWAEQRTFNPWVVGSSPTGGTAEANGQKRYREMRNLMSTSNVTGLPALIERYPRVREIVSDLNLTSVEAAEQVNRYLAQKGEGESTSQRSVRRARANLQHFLARPETLDAASPRDKEIPNWTPGYVVDEKQGVGELTTKPKKVESEKISPPPRDEEIFAEFGIDSQEWQIDKLRRSKWQSPSGEWLEAFKVTFAKRQALSEQIRISPEDLERYLQAYPSFTPLENPSGKVILAAIGDTQIGKSDQGGTEGVIDRFCAITEKLVLRLKKEKPSLLVLAVLGDCLEGIVSQGGRMVAKLDLSVTEQLRVYRRLLIHIIAKVAPLAERVLIPVVGGNHDEAYRQQDMGVHDSWALEGASAVADALSLDPEKFGHVEFLFPERTRLGVTVNLLSEETPYVVHFEHGHMARSPEKIPDWWKGQAMGRQPAGEADMLMTAHWHHLRVQQIGDRVWVQVPALEGGSDWYRNRAGEETPPGMLVMEITGDQVGFRNMEILTAG